MDDAIAAVPAHLHLVRPGYLHFNDLPGFLGGALVVAFPSTGEGFGLPALEAMACGAAVLTTHLTSLPEVGGDAVAYTEPDADGIRVALRALLEDPARRKALGAAGYTRAMEFSWAAQPRRTWPPKCVRRPRDGISLAAHAERFRPREQITARDRGTGGIEAILLVGGQGTRLRPLTIGDAQAAAADGRRAVPRAPAGPSGGGRITRVVLATAYRAEMFAGAAR